MFLSAKARFSKLLLNTKVVPQKDYNGQNLTPFPWILILETVNNSFENVLSN